METYVAQSSTLDEMVVTLDHLREVASGINEPTLVKAIEAAIRAAHEERHKLLDRAEDGSKS